MEINPKYFKQLQIQDKLTAHELIVLQQVKKTAEGNLESTNSWQNVVMAGVPVLLSKIKHR